MERLIDLIDQLNSSVDFVLLDLRRKIDENPEEQQIDCFLPNSQSLSLLCNRSQFHRQHHHLFDYELGHRLFLSDLLFQVAHRLTARKRRESLYSHVNFIFNRFIVPEPFVEV